MAFPLAYLISWRTYGTWLHGDRRGSVDPEHNEFNTPLIGPSAALRKRDSISMKHAAITLADPHRAVVDQAIRDHCIIRGWDLRAVNIRTNHAHTVVACGEVEPEPVMEQFKAWATRRLREARMFPVHKGVGQAREYAVPLVSEGC
jgi:hypothetical protein